jgi:DNA-directed RNA polymerase subunit RPC12/RpoP
MAFAPTCLKCGSILMGYDWDRELNYPVYFCTECGAGAPAQKAAAKAEAA